MDRSPARFRALLPFLTLWLLNPLVASAQDGALPEIPYTKFVLDNGLTVIVHEDHKAPIIAVNVWYHVGSKNEKPGRTGFAHLFEHLMFNGSENYDHDYFQVLEPLGATELNGTTNNDRTNYFQNVPTSALDVALWMESDRMGHLVGAITQEKLDEQRGVVQNEKRQGENNPYGQVFNTLYANTYPEGHPYSWPVIGSMEDLEAASLDDVKQWFQTYYGAANAVLVLAGDIDVATAREKAQAYFGDIPPGPPIAKHDVWVARGTGTHRMTMQDRVPQARIYKVWNVPEWGSEATVELALAARVLSSGKTSRLYKRLVYDDQIATDVSAFVFEREIGSWFILQASARPGVELATVEAALDEELQRFLAEGPGADELAREQTEARAGFIRGIERIGGFGGKSDVLAESEVFGGTPDAYRRRMELQGAATPSQVGSAARTWLEDGAFVLEVLPYTHGRFQAVASGIDRTRLPEAGAPPLARFPGLSHRTLSNGLEVVVAERPSIPVVDITLMVDAGYAADAGAVPGTASLAMAMLDEGTARRSALTLADELQRLGAFLGAGSDLDMSFVSLNALAENLDASLDVMADVVLHPAFPEADFQRLKQQRLVQIEQEKTQPVAMALRVLPKIMYGEGHAYSIPLTGSGTQESVGTLTRDDMIRFHRTWFKPNNAKLVVVGATTADEIVPKLERAFRDWQPGSVPEKNLAAVEQQEGQAIYIMDRPEAMQSMIIAGQIAPPKSTPDDLAIDVMNTALGGDFTARINMNLREDKHWSYGATSFIWDARGQRPFVVFAPVQTDKTKESVQEILSELTGVTGERPLTQDELERAQASRTLTLPGSWETQGAVATSIVNMLEYQLPEDHFDTLAERIRALRLQDVNSAARGLLRPDRLIWVVVGDRAEIEEGLRALHLGPIYEIDADGNVKGRPIS
ncbi:MAG: pitrilysin family protein [Gemmatimonadota bacterium]